MAGGIDWFRWHHGSVTDPKFQLVARKSGASLPDVLAVWAYLLETASAATVRGHIGDIDAEALDCLFGFPSAETRTADILEAMENRSLIADGVVLSWEKRQPKRERPEDDSTNRVRTHRDKKRHGTPSNADDDAETPREEKRREEEKREKERAEFLAAQARADGFQPTPAGSICRVMRDAGIQDTNPGDPLLALLVAAGATADEFAGAAAIAFKAGKGFAYTLAKVKGQREDAAKAAASVGQGVKPAAQSITVPSKAADETARYLREQAENARIVEQQRLARIARKQQEAA
jgi:hypothetical protein